eukprot:5408883-Pleurochrysis_carterae.AAC.1
MCYARSSESYCVALVCPVHASLKKLAAGMGIQTEDMSELCSDKRLVAEVTKECQKAVKGKL